ncbi:MAG TPA: hypothetical protein VMD75_05975 [Candidatus Binataceae bacterium]|nr:hypothetical protein [Candidatus Binataceae bacterium]
MPLFKQSAPAIRAGFLGVAATMIFVGAFAQEALVIAIGAGLSVGAFVLAFRPTLRSFLMLFYR